MTDPATNIQSNPNPNPVDQTEKKVSLIHKILKSFLIATLASQIFVIIFYLSLNIFFRSITGLGFENISYEQGGGFLLIQTLFMAVPVFIAAFFGRYLLYTSRPKRIMLVMLIVPLILVLGWSGFWWFITATTPDIGLGAIFTMTFFVLGLVSIVPILIYNFFTAKILFHLRFNRKKARLWSIPAGLFLLLFFGFIVFVSFSGWSRTKDIEVVSGGDINTSTKVVETKSVQITKGQFEAVKTDDTPSFLDSEKTQDKDTLLITYRTKDKNQGELIYESNPLKEEGDRLFYIDNKTGETKQISNTPCLGGVFSPDYGKVLFTESINGLCTKHFVFDLKTSEKINIDSNNTDPINWIGNDKILYQKFRTGDIFLGGSDLWVEDLATKETKQITKNVDIDPQIYSRGVEFFPVSPNINLVAFSNKKGLFIAKLEGTKVLQVAGDVCGEFDLLDPRYTPKSNNESTSTDVKGNVACREIKWLRDSKKLYVHKFNLDVDVETEGDRKITTITESSAGYWEITLGNI